MIGIDEALYKACEDNRKLEVEIEQKDKEIERLNKRVEDLKIINEEHQVLNGMIRKQLQQKENIIKEVRESAKRELKIAEENIKNSEKWLDVEEEQDNAKRDIHTGKIVKRYMEMVLEILDKEVN